MTSRSVTTLAGLAAALAMLGPAAAPAAETVSRQIPAVDACAKTVNALGASMGHTADATAEGRPIYRFVLRTNGLDYDVVCDAESGLVSDVTPRTSH